MPNPHTFTGDPKKPGVLVNVTITEGEDVLLVIDCITKDQLLWIH